MLTYAQYAPEELERELGLRYEPVSVQIQHTLHEQIQRISDVLGPDAPTPVVPPKGCLTSALRQEQLTGLNLALSRAYAASNALQQEALHTIPIQECMEKVVPLPYALRKEEVQATFSGEGFHEACGSWAKKKRMYWLRSTVAKRLAMVCRGLHVIGLQPHIEDCWRPWQVQKGLLIRRMIQIARDYPEWDWECVRMVAMSFTAPAPGVAGHQAASAIDLRLRHIEGNQDFLDLGNQYAEGGIHASLDSPYITVEQWRTRQLFAAVMQMSGFRMLRTEDWHIHDGDRGMGHDGNIHMLSARFGPIQRFERSGEVVPYQPPWIDGHFLNEKECQMLIEQSRAQKGSAYQFQPKELYAFLQERPEHFQKIH